jgi:hypothetical protein
MIYVFYTMTFLIGVFIVMEIVDALKRREWGENP